MTEKPSYQELETRVFDLETRLSEYSIKEKDHHQANAELDAIFSSTPFPMFMLDRDRRLCRINTAGTAFLNRVENELIGLRGGEAFGCIHAFDRPEGCGYSEACKVCVVKSTVMDTFQTGNNHVSVKASIPFAMNDDEGVFQVLLSTAFVKTEARERVLVCMNDITLREKAERELRNLEDFHDSLFQNNHSAMLVIDPDTADIVDANPAAVNFYGWSREELTAKKIHDLNTLSMEEARDEIVKGRETNQSHFLFQHRVADGSVRDVEVYSGSITLNRKRLLFSIIHDISERKLAEVKLKESNQTARVLLDASSDSVYLIDTRGMFLELNEICAKRLGRTVDELVGTNVFDTLSGELVESMRSILEEIVREKKPVMYEAIRAGRILLNRLFPIRDENGNVYRVACYSRDITDQRHYEAGLIASKNELQLQNQIADILLNFEGAEMYNQILSLILKEFSSEFGYFGYIDEDGNFVCPSLTHDVWDKCSIENKTSVFPKKAWGGLWGQSLIENKLFVSNHSLSPPEGHVPLARALICPIVFKSKLLGQLALANKQTDYNEADKKSIKSIAAFIAPILLSRLQKERDSRKRIRAEKEKEDLIEKLQSALNQVKQLKGLIPICASCKKIRDDQGYWNQLESFIERHSEALFSHSVCPECAERLYGDSKWFHKSRKKNE